MPVLDTPVATPNARQAHNCREFPFAVAPGYPQLILDDGTSYNRLSISIIDIDVILRHTNGLGSNGRVEA